ncbi:MAG: hypothetical protein EOO47_08990 [Flavobacterium sp.]|nr:MAG: hypothetical protein EOO47_08990 [Flavobacterium sp.]
MKKISILLFFVSFYFVTNAQVAPIYFYGNQVTQNKEKATSYAVYGKLSTGDIYTFKRFDLYDNLLQTGSFSDESLAVPHGKFTFYSDVNEFNLLYKQSFTIKGKTRFVSQEGNFVNGVEQGKWLLYFPDGNVFNSQEFVDGKLDGKFLTFDRYGKTIVSGNYVLGEKDGEWLFEKDKIREVWNNGVLVLREKIKKSKQIKGTIQSKNN